MRLWYGRFAELEPDGGYFYLCPRCYERLIEPHAGEIIQRLVEQHPFLRRGEAAHYHAESPATPPPPARELPRPVQEPSPPTP